MHSHNLALLALLWLPAALALLRRIGAIGARWDRIDPLTRAALLLMSVAATVHLALIPAHAADPLTATLFALDAAALAIVGAAALAAVPAWRIAAIALLAGAVGACVLYVVAGREVLDFTGVATKLVELAAIELLVLSGPARSLYDGSRAARRDDRLPAAARRRSGG